MSGIPIDPLTVEPVNPDPFIEAVKGRVPLSKNIGAARTWVPTKEPTAAGDAKFAKEATEDTGPYVPRPDVSLGGLRAMSFFTGIIGLDHFFLRSPSTGFIKMILGIACIVYLITSPLPNQINWAVPLGLLVWYIWDNLQLWTESERVLNYGLTAPFDFLTGIGQGMITDKDSYYEARNGFLWWGLAIVFGFIGFDSAYLGKWGLFLRKLIDGSIFGTSLYEFVKNYSSFSTAGAAIFGIFIVGIGIMVILPWATTLYNYTFNASAMMTEGIKVPAKDYLDLFGNWILKDSMPKANEIITEEFGYSTMSASDLQNKFELLYKSTLDVEETKGNQNPWLKSFFLGNIITGGIGYNLANLITYAIKWFVPGVTLLSETVEAGYTRVQSGGARRPHTSPVAPLSTEAKILGSAIIAIITGGGLKGLVDYLMKE